MPPLSSTLYGLLRPLDIYQRIKIIKLFDFKTDREVGQGKMSVEILLFGNVIFIF